MRMTTILGGVASSAVIVAMAVVYLTADRAQAAVDPTTFTLGQDRHPDHIPQWFGMPPKIDAEPSIAPVDSIRPRQRPNQYLPPSVYDDAQLYCLAQNIYFESRGESLEGQAAVAWVTLNRVLDHRFPNTICKVVWQDSQFSWTQDGNSDVPGEAMSWDRAQDIALDLVYNYDPELDPTSGSTYFHERSVRPSWSRRFERVGQIDNHIFYADRG
jgi:spore germination cell wall hydrolase CwlJ-like protein